MHEIEDCHVALPFIESLQCLLLHLFVYSNKVLCSHLRGCQDVSGVEEVIDVLEKNKIIFLLICFCLANFNATSMVVDLAIIVVPVLHFRDASSHIEWYN